MRKHDHLGMIFQERDVLMGKRKKASQHSSQPARDKIIRSFYADSTGNKVGFMSLDRNVSANGEILRYSVTLVFLPEHDFCGPRKDLRILGFDVKRHDGKTGDCHKHCVCRSIVLPMYGNDCSYTKVVEQFLCEIRQIALYMDWNIP